MAILDSKPGVYLGFQKDVVSGMGGGRRYTAFQKVRAIRIQISPKSAISEGGWVGGAAGS